MYVMDAAMVRELGIMHLVIRFKTYKTTSWVVTHVMGRIDEVLVKVGSIHCTMTFMVVDCEMTFCPSILDSMRWLYLKVHMLLMKEKCKCISRC
jgi:hypothetical protein